MSQPVEMSVIMSGFSTCADGSLTLRFSTLELLPEELTAISSLRKTELTMLLTPTGAVEAPKEIRGEFSKRSQSERIRAVIFVWWKHLGEPGSFLDFYNCETEKTINSIKAKLPAEQPF